MINSKFENVTSKFKNTNNYIIVKIINSKRTIYIVLNVLGTGTEIIFASNFKKNIQDFLNEKGSD